MFRIDTDHTVTVRRPDPESGELVTVDVIVKKGAHQLGAKKGQAGADFDVALEQLWYAGLATDDDRPVDVEVTDIATGEPVVIETPAATTETAEV